jgi:uncharacterized protein YecT (DUF1311 family)
MKKTTIAFLLAVIASPTTQASMALNCSEAANFDDKQVGYCVEQEARFMKENLQELGKTYTHLSWDKIQNSQKTWESYMNANCAFHKLNAGGGGADIKALKQCKVRMMVERNLELEYISMSNQ